MKTTCSLTEAEIKEAIAFWMQSTRRMIVKDVDLRPFAPSGQDPREQEYIVAVAEIDDTPTNAKPVWTGSR